MPRDSMEGNGEEKQLHLYCVVSSPSPFCPPTTPNCFFHWLSDEASVVSKKNINILSKTILGFINGGFLLYLTENQVYLTLLHASLHCDFPPQNLWLLSHWLVVWTSFSVHTPSSVSQRAGCVTQSPTALISLMKSIVPLLYPELFLLRSFVLLVIFSVQIITASRP